MNIKVREVEKDKMYEFTKVAHTICFSEQRPEEFNRYNYGLVTTKEEDDEITGYCTILEQDENTGYMQHGGALTKDKLAITKSYLLMIAHLKNKYPIVTTRIFNDNISMLKLAMQAGLRIHGVEYYQESKYLKGGILLNLKMENE